MDQSLSDSQRRQIHDLALDARTLLTQEARELLEGVYGLYADGRLDPPEKLPQVRTDPETAETYRRLKAFLDDEVRAGLGREEAVEKLVKEIAYTHLNRLVAFKMMEARKLIRGTLDKGTESNAFKFYLADPDHADDLALYQQGDQPIAYRHFLLWQAGQVAQEVRVLFDPDNLVSRLFPRPAALDKLLAMLNNPALAPAWDAEETIGWIYQFFNENEKAVVFDRLNKQKLKIRRQDIPAATQLFTPDWIVRFLVQNTLGRTWVQMHPDTRLLESELLDYLVPMEGEVPAESLRPIGEITLLDPSCGTMHFGLVAFDLYYAMYQEEMERAGEPGWPDVPSVADQDDIPAAIISRNLFAIDIDLRAVQLSALTLYLKAKSYNKSAHITDSNLVCADVLPLNGERLDAFLEQAQFSPLTERLIRELWHQLRDVNQVGSLLRLEQALGQLLERIQAEYRKAPLLARMEAGYQAGAQDEDFWDVLAQQIVQGLDAFAQEQSDEGVDMRFFAGEASKGLRLLDVMLRDYDVVVTNPPYSARGKLDDVVASFLDRHYPDEKGDLYAAFIARCSEFVGDAGRLGMITQQSFMFISSYEKLRAKLRATYAIEAIAHTGTRAFAEISGEVVNTTVFCLHREANPTVRDATNGTYFRLVHAPDGDGKRLGFEEALQDESPIYCVAQGRFDAIPGAPWVYWVSETIRRLFETLPKFGEIGLVKLGLSAVDVFRFNRFHWEVKASDERWFRLMKGGGPTKWYGHNEIVVNWESQGKEFKEEVIHRYPYLNGNYGLKVRDEDYLGMEGSTYSNLGGSTFSARLMPSDSLFDDTGPAIFSRDEDNLGLLGFVNSSAIGYFLNLINPSIHFQKGDLAKLPVPSKGFQALRGIVSKCILDAAKMATFEETDFLFGQPKLGGTGHVQSAFDVAHAATIVDSIVFAAYEISENDQEIIHSELNGKIQEHELDEEGTTESNVAITKAPDSWNYDLATRWISYATGIILGRFSPGTPNALGRAVYHRDDFAIGSLPAPDEAEFDELVGPPAQFAYVDEDGGRHVFSAATEQALRDLAVPDGITVLDEGHPRDLPALVEKALRLMLGDEQTREVIDEAAGGDLRRFLERDYFTKWHFKWYRSRPVYWPIQSARRSYGFVLFHEKIDDQTFYTLQRDYLDAKLNGLRLHIDDLRAQAAGQSGTTLKRIEREIDRTTQQLEEITDFAQTMERVVRDGYRPEPNWIDDGIILRMAPLWELVPIWRAEPKKYWERLEAGQYDWSHIAMAYWPDRVRGACQTNKSFAIAHGHESWYEGA